MSLQIQPFEASPCLIASPIPSYSSYLSKSLTLPTSDSAGLLNWDRPRHFKTAFRALSFRLRSAIIVITVVSVGAIYWRWNLGLVGLSVPLGSLDFSASPDQYNPRPLPAPVPFPIVAELSLDSNRDLALDAELGNLASEFQKRIGSFPTPLFAMPRLSPPQQQRYAHLRQGLGGPHNSSKIMLVASLKNVQELLYDLVHAICVVTSFLGPGQVSISLIEGPSTDKTPRILDEVLYPSLIRLGVAPSDIHLQLNMSTVDWRSRNRIELLAELRNLALEPVWEDNGLDVEGKATRAKAKDVKYNGPRTVGKDIGAVVFFNDVYLSAAHILELLHQHVRAGDDTGQAPAMTNGMDYRIGNAGEETFFYDVWVARTVENGDLFRDFPHEGEGHNMFRGFAHLEQKYTDLQPFPAFCAWNGIAVINPSVFLPPYNIRFRRSDQRANECAASECSLFCSDLWSMGLGRIQVVPSVRVAYELELATRTMMESEDAQAANGWQEGVPLPEMDPGIEWIETPPKWVRCYPWPEGNGATLWPWNEFRWVEPWVGFPKTRRVSEG